MWRRIVPLFLLLFVGVPLLAQNVGDQYTAGFTTARSYANTDLRDFAPPFRLFETINLTGIDDARSIGVVEDQFLVGQGGATIRYALFSRAGGTVWTENLAGGTGQPLNYVPAFGGDVVILGGESTTTIKAVKVSDGTDLWSDAQVGNAFGRHPAVTDDLFVYAGQSGIKAVRLNGATFWQSATTTASAAISVYGTNVYFLDSTGGIRAWDLTNGQEKWSVADATADGASMIATEKYLFVNDPRFGYVGALKARTGELAWNSVVTLSGVFSSTPALAFGYGRLYAFRQDDGNGLATVSAHDPDTGELIWRAEEEGAGLDYGFVANDVVYYFHGASNRVRARDAATGTLLWSIHQPGVRGLTAANEELVVLLGNSIQIYRPTHEIFLAQMANGEGQTTLVTLANAASEAANVTVEFYGEDGSPVQLPVVTFGQVESVALVIPANSSASLQTQDTGGSLVSGWIRVVSDQRLRGAALYQYSTAGDIVREAGVGDSVATGEANVFVSTLATFGTGLAFANPSDEDAEVAIRLLNNSGIELGVKTLDLPSGAHLARFVGELFEEEVGETFSGTVVIQSDVPVAVTALRTKGGLQLSSYPVGQAVR